ncbi:MAG TPA: VIT1/CCC1 transporter family protein [Acidimicrobiales bacterium]|nr:VIT1/CCC1 transporter family protein [Acidimicrobiales bacterium]
MPHEEEHRNVTSGGARAAVFGMSDGLVTNVSLILGFAGAHPAATVVRLAGLAGLVAGAFSMGAGEYLSMAAQRGLFERELSIERRALQETPEGETEELVEIFRRKGLAPELARRLATEVMSDPDLALETHAREEFGVDPRSLGSPWAAAISSFVAFTVGAFLPLLPWLIGGGAAAVAWSIVISAATAAALGATLGRLTSSSMWLGAVRTLGIATLAAGVTYGVGRAVGAG